MLAAAEGNNDMIRVLLEKGADLHARDSDARTALVSAVGHPDSLKLLLDTGAEIDSRDSPYRWTPLMHAIYRGGSDKDVAVLLERGADIRHTTADGQVMEILAAADGDVSKMQLLLRFGANPNARSIGADTPLMTAAYHGNADMCRFLLNSGANMESENGWSETALIAACDRGHMTICKELLAKTEKSPPPADEALAARSAARRLIARGDIRRHSANLSEARQRYIEAFDLLREAAVEVDNLKCLLLVRLMKTSHIEGRIGEACDYGFQAIALLPDMLRQGEVSPLSTEDIFEQLTFNLLLAGKLIKAEEVAEMGLEISPLAVKLKLRKAHVHMMSGRIAQSLDMHRNYWYFHSNDVKWREMCRQDFAQMRSLGIDDNHMTEVEDLLASFGE